MMQPRIAESGNSGQQAPTRTELTKRLNALLGAPPETGEQWAEICWLEDQIINGVRS